MMARGAGVILMFGGYGDPPVNHNLGGLQVAFGALVRQPHSVILGVSWSSVRSTM